MTEPTPPPPDLTDQLATLSAQLAAGLAPAAPQLPEQTERIAAIQEAADACAARVREALRRAGEAVEPLEPPLCPAPQPTPPQPSRTPEAPRTVRRVPVEIDWVTIPAGEFLMGSKLRVDKDAYKDEQRQHPVYLPAYRIARVPVTVAQFAVFVQQTGYRTAAEQEGRQWMWHHPSRQGSDAAGKAHHPVTRVSWPDAVAFCGWLSEASGQRVRLPTEAEWEKAARGTDGRLYPWGNEWPDARLLNYDHNVGDTTPVGHYPAGASPYGVLDMAGNVWEWTASLGTPYPYCEGDGRNDPVAQGIRMLRGGSWRDNQRNVRCAYRLRNPPGGFYDNFGFRVVVSLSFSGS